MRRPLTAPLAAIALTLSVVSPASAVNPIITSVYRWPSPVSVSRSAANTYNVTTFGVVSTTRLRLNITSRSGFSTGMLEWLALN